MCKGQNLQFRTKIAYKYNIMLEVMQSLQYLIHLSL